MQDVEIIKSFFNKMGIRSRTVHYAFLLAARGTKSNLGLHRLSVLYLQLLSF